MLHEVENLIIAARRAKLNGQGIRGTAAIQANFIYCCVAMAWVNYAWLVFICDI